MSDTIYDLAIIGAGVGLLRRVQAARLAEPIFAHLSLNEAALEAAEGIFGQATHLPKPRERK